MERFFQAQSVAVVGVSNSPGNMGRAMVSNLLEFRYQGVIYLVGPKGGAFLGHKIYPSVLDIPEPVELASILIPAQAVPEVLRQCAVKGIPRVVLESAGFRELGTERRQLEEEIRDILNRHGMRMIGPNCIGIINRRTGLAVPFMPFRAEAPVGRIAIVSQSGGVGATMINTLAAEHLGFSKFVSIGNKLDVDEGDLLEYLARDPETDSIFCYLEGIADGRRLMEITSHSSKPIIVYKSNKGGAGAVIARSHSASLSTDDAVVSAALRQCGIVRVEEQREAAEWLKALSLQPMRGRRLAIISRSGGHAVMAADAADEYGFELPPYPDEVIAMVRDRSRAKVIQLHNPMDLGDLFDMDLYRMLVEITLARDNVDGLLFIHNYQGIFDAEPSRQLLKSFAEIAATLAKPLAVCVFTTAEELAYNRQAVTYPIFSDPREAVRALAHRRDRKSAQPFPFAQQPPTGIDRERVSAELTGYEPRSPQLAPDRTARIMAAYGIPLVPWQLADRVEAAVAAAQSMGFPLAMKTANPAIIHKSDLGGVMLNLAGEAAVRDAYRKLEELGGAAVMVQKMAEPGLEWLVGGRQDEHFGPVLVVGMGGIYVEVLRETAIRVGPVTLDEAQRALDECRGAALLAGVRGQPPLDREALAELVVRVSWLLYDYPAVRELDLNPVRVFAAGQGACALDWRILVSRDGG